MQAKGQEGEVGSEVEPGPRRSRSNRGASRHVGAGWMPPWATFCTKAQEPGVQNNHEPCFRQSHAVLPACGAVWGPAWKPCSADAVSCTRHLRVTKGYKCTIWNEAEPLSSSPVGFILQRKCFSSSDWMHENGSDVSTMVKGMQRGSCV